MKLILLTRGLFAMVDDEDFEYLNQWKWCADLNKSTNNSYAVSNQRIGSGSPPKRKAIAMHRLIMSATKGQIVDHKDGNTLNNCRSNLRFCTPTQNSANRRVSSKSTSQFLGVSFRKYDKKWIAQIQVNKKVKYLGCFDNEIDAAIVYNNAAIKHHGEFARLNII